MQFIVFGEFRYFDKIMNACTNSTPITSLIPNPANGNIGMTAANRKMHKQISIMHIHAQFMQKFVLEKSGYADLSTGVQSRMGLDRARCAAEHSRTTVHCSQKSWNNFVRGIFLTVLKLFQSWNIIPRLSTNYGISIFQLFHSTSTRLEYYSRIFHAYRNTTEICSRILSFATTTYESLVFTSRSASNSEPASEYILAPASFAIRYPAAMSVGRILPRRST
jgi:hypothetical protein